MTGVIVQHVLHLTSVSYMIRVNMLIILSIIFQLSLLTLCVCVCFQGKETTEEEDEVAVGMEKGFMDEFFEQVRCACSHSLLLIGSHSRLLDSRILQSRSFVPLQSSQGSILSLSESIQMCCFSGVLSSIPCHFSTRGEV